MQQKTEILHRYWFEFEKPKPRDPEQGISFVCWPPAECGLTAYDYHDAVALLKLFLFRDEPLPTIANMTPDVDMNLVWDHYEYIRTDCSCPLWRGVWWPNYSGSGPIIGSVLNER